MALTDEIIKIIREHEQEAREDADAGRLATDPADRAFNRARAQGRRDVCFALRVALGISKISDLPKDVPQSDAEAELRLLRELRDAAVRWHDNVGDEEAEGALVIATERAAPKFWKPGEWPHKVGDYPR